MLFITKQLDILITCIFGVVAFIISSEALDGGGSVIASGTRLFGGRAALVAAPRVFSGNRAAGVRVALWVLLFIPVAAVIRLAGLFAVILITTVLIIVKKPGGKIFDINIDIGLDLSPDEGIIGCVLGAYLCGLYNKINGAVSRMKYLHRGHSDAMVRCHINIMSEQMMHHVW